ncbi:MAG TPA: DUF5681 domain-containing protein [Terriglobia bacterium]|jgi:hypothetical protein|nr:DUF5681 domain-containing protein [Terriglobia bacterium]
MTTSDDSVKGPYRVPPAEFRFVKGTSGNFKGRPPKERALVTTKFGGQPGIGFESRIKGIAIEEAYRLISIPDGNRVERIPLIQAILRKIGVNAANGNTRAQKIILNLVLGAEAERTAASAELLRAAVEGKEYWAAVFAECDRRGIDRPEPVPHPDDVVIDYQTGEVRIKGPVMTEQKDARETLIYNKKEFEKNLERCIKAMEADPDDLELRRRHKKLTQIIEWIGRGAPFTG